MIRYFILALLALALPLYVYGQEYMPIDIDLPADFERTYNLEVSAQKIAITDTDKNGIYISRKYVIPLQDAKPFIAWSASWISDAATLGMRFSRDNAIWDDWQTIDIDPHAHKGEDKHTGTLQFTDKDYRFFQFQIRLDKNSSTGLQDMRLFYISPGATEAVITKEEQVTIASADSCELISYWSREQWCPDSTCPPDPTPQPTAVTHLVVHHSAGSNTSSDWPAVVRAIYYFHVNTNGWDDIGYNWLIDPEGTLYQGRGNNLRGAHFCGNNSNTMGICVMGTYTTELPSDTARQKLIRLLAWKASVEQIEPLGTKWHPSSQTVHNNILGHKEGCSTACPGGAFHGTFPTLRQEVEDYTNDNCLITSTDNAQIEKNIRVFPNPTSGNLNIVIEEGQNTGDKEFILMNITGGILHKANFTNSNTSINIKGFPVGLHVWIVQENGVVVSRGKVVVE